MGTKYKNLYDQIHQIKNLRNAYQKASRGGNKFTEAHLKFKENLEANLFYLQTALIDGTYQHGHVQTADSHNLKSKIRGMYEQCAA